jgi:hypothetical protein
MVRVAKNCNFTITTAADGLEKRTFFIFIQSGIALLFDYRLHLFEERPEID